MDIIRDIILNSNTNDIMEFVRFFWFKNRYSIFNCLLIYAQRPGAVMLATANYWNSNYNRYIKHEVSPIVIMKPFGPVEFIYDYNDTYGEKELFPKRITISHNVEIKDWWLFDIIEALKSKGINYSESNFGTRKAADICILSNPRKYSYISKKGKEITVNTDCCITTNSQSDNKAKFTAIIHELAHLFCGHLPRGKYTPKEITFPNRQKENLTINQKEHEAELTSAIVLKIIGVKSFNPFEYLKDYQDQNGEKIEINYSNMIKAVDKILNLIPGLIDNNIQYPIDYIY